MHREVNQLLNCKDVFSQKFFVFELHKWVFKKYVQKVNSLTTAVHIYSC